MGGVVDARHERAEDRDEDHVAPDGPGEIRTRPPAVIEERAQQAAERGRGADGDSRRPAEEGNRDGGGPHEGGQQESRSRRDLEDHERPAGSEQLPDQREEIPEPVHVEEDVQQPAVEPAGAQDGVPLPDRKDRNPSRGPQPIENAAVRTQKPQNPPHLDGADAQHQRQQEEPDVGGEQDFQDALGIEAKDVREAEHPGVPAAAGKTLPVVHSDELSTAGAEHRALPFHTERHGAILPLRRCAAAPRRTPGPPPRLVRVPFPRGRDGAAGSAPPGLPPLPPDRFQRSPKRPKRRVAP